MHSHVEYAREIVELQEHFCVVLSAAGVKEEEPRSSDTDDGLIIGSAESGG